MLGCVLFHSLTSVANALLGLSQSHIVRLTLPLSAEPELAAQVEAEAEVGPATTPPELEEPQPAKAAINSNASPGATTRRGRTATKSRAIRSLLSPDHQLR